MTPAGDLLKTARERAGLSQRALAARARVAVTTVHHIEHGRQDPTIGTLERLLTAAGARLRMAAPPDGPELADLADAWVTRPGWSVPDWTRLRVFIDDLAMHPHRRGPATACEPEVSSPVLDNLLAGIAEKVNEDAGLRHPEWTQRVPPLSNLWHPGGTPRMIATWRERTPPQLARRNLIVNAASLWRDPTTVGL